VAPAKYPARQTLEASQAIARLHRLNPEYTVFAQQDPAAIDHGVFHNDVISVSNRHVLFHHQHAFLNQQAVLDTLREKPRGWISRLPASKCPRRRSVSMIPWPPICSTVSCSVKRMARC
jgi:succinylarginine dihydrolase